MNDQNIIQNLIDVISGRERNVNNIIKILSKYSKLSWLLKSVNGAVPRLTLWLVNKLLLSIEENEADLINFGLYHDCVQLEDVLKDFIKGVQDTLSKFVKDKNDLEIIKNCLIQIFPYLVLYLVILGNAIPLTDTEINLDKIPHGYSPAIMVWFDRKPLPDNPEGWSILFNALKDIYKLKMIEVRSRLSECCRLIFRVKQRFAERPISISPYVIDELKVRVKRRDVPIPEVDIDSLLDNLMKSLYAKIALMYLIHEKGMVKEDAEKVVDKVMSYFERIFRDFLKKIRQEIGIERLYSFQKRGIQSILESVAEMLERNKPNAVVLEAPTGAGKTEVFLISTLIVTLLIKLIFYLMRKGRPTSPTVLIVYPRRALATDQLRRLIQYIHMLNESIKSVLLEDVRIHLSVNYSEVRFFNEIMDALRGNDAPNFIKELNGIDDLETAFYEGRELKISRRGQERIWQHVLRYINHKKRAYYALYCLPYVWCPKCRSENLGFRVRISYGTNISDVLKKLSEEIERQRVSGRVALCCPKCGREVDFIRVFRDDVYASPGDIHVTLLESLRRDMLQKGAQNLFVSHNNRPLIMVLDEVHIYESIHGSRAAHIFARIRYRMLNSSRKRRKGLTYVCLSATIPKAKEHVSKLLLINKQGVKVVDVEEWEVIDFGADHFIFLLPSIRYSISLLAATIQPVMVLLTCMYRDIPREVTRGKLPLYERALIFTDELDITWKLYHDLSDALCRNVMSLENTILKSIYGNDYEKIKKYGKRRLRKSAPYYGLHILRYPLDNSDYYSFSFGGDTIMARTSLFNLTTLRPMGITLNCQRCIKSTAPYRNCTVYILGECWWFFAKDIERGVISNSKRMLLNRDSDIGLHTSRSRLTSSKLSELPVIVTTSSLEVGINYRRVRLIYQHGMPRTISQLVQRAGRAGREVIINPLIRSFICVQVSPYSHKHMAWYERFKIKPLEDLVKEEVIPLAPWARRILMEQMVELAFEYLVTNEKVEQDYEVLYVNSPEALEKYIREIRNSWETVEDYIKRYFTDICELYEIKSKIPSLLTQIRQLFERGSI